MSHYHLFIVYVVTAYGVLAYHDGATTKTYNMLDADQIRLIDGGPLWNSAPADVVITTRRPTTHAEHRALQSNFKKTKFRTQHKDAEIDQPSQEASKELNEFLKSYAEKIKRKKPVTTEEPEPDSYERFHKVELITKASEEPTNRLANLLLNGKYKENIEEKSKGWDVVKKKPNQQPQLQHHQHDDDKKGWVSLEVVPWSVSKVAKWHSSSIKQTSESRPRPEYHVSTVPAWNYPMQKPLVTYNPTYKPSLNYNPTTSNYKKKPFNYGGDNYGEENYARPFDTTSITTPEKVYYQQEYIDDIQKHWNKHPQVSYAQYDTNNSDDEEDNLEAGYAGIITDGLPPNFPGFRPNYNRRKGFPGDTEHPLSHPFNGDGDWVLLTTTKGYKGSNGRQRSLDIDAIPEQDVESIKTHKSVRLTVLPPLNGSKINMTTSHGGLLQVESTFETVDEAQKLAEKKENTKKGSLKTKQTKKHVKLPDAVVSTTAPTTSSSFKFPAPSSVLAAVGAGMIPATMAMLVPMAMGRKRKREVFDQIAQPKTFRFPLPIQIKHRY